MVALMGVVLNVATSFRWFLHCGTNNVDLKIRCSMCIETTWIRERR